MKFVIFIFSFLPALFAQELSEPCICTADYTPVCGVDGRTYGNACEAQCGNVEIAKTGECVERPTTNSEMCASGCTNLRSQDGCNNCFCSQEQPDLQGCTMMMCPPGQTTFPKCLKCAADYQLKDGMCFQLSTV
eukprot:Filipodium_phascolosomae@DN905_c0_g1_i1.p1